MTNGNRIKINLEKIFVWAVLIILTLGEICIYPELLGAQQETNKEATAKLLSIVSEASADEVARLIQEGANVNAVGEDDGQTPLMIAALNNSNPDVLRVLIKEGADVNAGCRWTPLMIAAENNENPDVLRVLIEGGANVNIATYDGWTPLMRAARDNKNPEVMRVLIEGGANVNAVNEDGQTPLMIAAYYNYNPEVSRFLIEGGADVNAVGRWTPLMFAALDNGNPEDSQFIIVNDGDVSNVKTGGRTPLAIAALYNENPEVLRVLIEGGADVTFVNKYGQTPFTYATRNKSASPEFLQILIDGGADVNAVPSRKEATDELLSVVSYANYFEVTRLIEEGADVNAVDGYGWTPLMLAAMDNSDYSVLRILIEEGADVNAVDINGWTPLMLANWYNSDSLTELLIKNGADVNMVDKKGRKASDFDDNDNILKEILAYRNRGSTFSNSINLDLYHPWFEAENCANSLARLDFPASLRISKDYPILDGGTSAYPLYAAVANEVYEVDYLEDLGQYLFCSRTAIAYEKLIEGFVDIIFVAQPSDLQLHSARDAGIELELTPIAKDAFVFFVNDRNPVNGLSVEQIRNIYLKKITNWREVGGNDHRILPFQREPDSGSQTAMEKEVMKGEKLHPTLGAISEGMDGMYFEVAQYRDQEESIGYSFRFFTEEMVRKVLSEKMEELESLSQYPPESSEREVREQYLELLKPVKLLAVDGIEPSIENIRNGTYPFTISVYAVTTEKSNPRSKEIIDWMLSPQGQELIEKTGFVGAVGARD